MAQTPSEAAVRAANKLFKAGYLKSGKSHRSARLIDEAFGAEEVVKALETISKYPGLSAKNIKAIVDEALSKLKGIDDAH